ncbi:MFS transporter [Helicobacter cinaedi]|uniref:Major facilitator superfamily protein n=1 Tax=Helicobacter cinaedi CCUG 18818 = ATCC BAA-847 TaxID=537971 RepID=A0AAI8MLJ9_9HELI|nr:MFS transporter [Helicobacter cinaedi]EFR46359.1 transporter, major facilitator family protein [Helicobacter cinaedi CCUG 18818 = ATCC BAA-847]QOQ90055.1 MFS transporter [Helicobacter cinaedi]BAM31803.1 major facilitator superfamily protein [Helicobacter cinaedi CCUG 18818 = ATCC BAA-847]
MDIKTKVSVIYIAIITLSSIYIPQPILPLLALEFGTTAQNTSAITSITLLPMAFAPLFYGYFLENHQPKLILSLSLFVAGIFQILLAWCESLETFLLLRFIQSLFFPAILTTLLTILTRSQSGSLQFNVSLYIASTIAGGLIGRMGGAYLTELFSWQICFILLGVSLTLGGIFSLSWIANQASKLTQFTFSQILPLLGNKTSLVVLSSVFVMFFSFQAVLNTLPFYAKEMFPHISQNELGRLYLGYSIGIVVSLLANPIIKLCGGREKTIFLSLNLFALGLCVFLLHSLMWIYVGMFVMCFGSFIAHSVLNALNNSLNPKYKAASSGLYLSFYYTGGTLGSYLSSFVFELFGWQMLIISLAITLNLTSFVFYHHMTHIKKEA